MDTLASVSTRERNARVSPKNATLASQRTHALENVAPKNAAWKVVVTAVDTRGDREHFSWMSFEPKKLIV